MQTEKSLLDQLDGLAKKVSSQMKRINHGGCCVYATLVANHLQHIVPTRFVVFHGGWRPDEDLDLDDVRNQVTSNCLLEWNGCGVYFGHVVIEFDYDGKTYHYDSEGWTDSDGSICQGSVRIKGYLLKQDADELADDEYGWNDTFDRNQIPKMKRIIDDYFETIS
jgi:hypothetical protein